MEKTKTVIIIILVAFILFTFKSCPRDKETQDLQSKINDLKQENATIEKHANFLDSELKKAKNNTKIKLVEVVKYKVADQKQYFKDNYKADVIIDSIPAKEIITDLEIGKGAVIENQFLTNIVKSKDSSIVNLKDQNNLLFDVSKIHEKNFKTQKNKTLFWKIATVGGIIGTYLIVK